MSLTLDAFKEASKPPRNRCTLAVVADALDAKDRAALETALADEAITGKAISKVLKAAGHRIEANTVTRHRRGECTCPKEAA